MAHIFGFVVVGATRGFSTFTTVRTPATGLLHNKASVGKHSAKGFGRHHPLQSAIRSAQRGDPRRRFISTASAVAFSAFFFTTCVIQVYASNCDLHSWSQMIGTKLCFARRKTNSGLRDVNYTSFRGGDIEQSDVFDVFPKETPPIEFAHGTTTVSFVFQGGIVAAVDSRARWDSYAIYSN